MLSRKQHFRFCLDFSSGGRGWNPSPTNSIERAGGRGRPPLRILSRLSGECRGRRPRRPGRIISAPTNYIRGGIENVGDDDYIVPILPLPLGEVDFRRRRKDGEGKQPTKHPLRRLRRGLSPHKTKNRGMAIAIPRSHSVW